MDIEELKKDKVRLEKLLQNTQIQVWRLEGALSYVMDNIKKLEKGVEDDRKGTDT